MRSTQSHKFDQTKRADIPRSSFDLSHGSKLTLDASVLVPILNLEVLPADTINLRAALFGRLATIQKPILDNLHLETFFFFTPTRQVWDHWVHFNGEQDNPTDSTDYVIPTITTTAVLGDIYDYMGIPPATANPLTFSAIPFRILNHIFNNWFRDQNLVDRLPVNTGDGPDDPASYKLFTRRKKLDYLTGCLPWPQKGDPVTVPLVGQAEVHVPGGSSNTDQPSMYSDLDGQWQRMVANPSLVELGATGGSNMYADMTTVQGFTISELRESFQIQRLLERDARAGTRYPETLRAHFGVTDPAMLVHQRPLFLGGGHTMINIAPVPQTQRTDSTVPEETPQANLAAYGTVAANNHGFTASFTEHGFITGFVCVRADITYQQNLERYWRRQTRYDFYWPVLSHLSEQSVQASEIYADGSSNDDLTFGYQERYAEYRYCPSRLSGLFRSNATASLDVWHLAQDFASLPTLSKEFVEENVPLDRVVAVPSEPDLLLDIYFTIRAARPLPLYGTPGLIDHF